MIQRKCALWCWTVLCILPVDSFADASTQPVPSSALSRDAEAAWCASVLVAPSRPTVTASIEPVPPDGAAAAPGRRAEPHELIVSLSLSGGGYRAMLFHVGLLRRLNDAGMLPRLAVISSVSGGSIASAYLAYRWNALQFDSADRATNLQDVIEAPLRELARTTLDIPSILGGLLPMTSSARQQVNQFDDRLFHRALLSEVMPGGADTGTNRPRPLFIFNSTNLQTGELWQFRASAIGGPITHWTKPGTTRLSEAVAASSGFPPFLSPLVLHPADGDVPSQWHNCNDFRDNPYGVAYDHEPGRVLPPDAGALGFRQSVYLIDGGVRDNLGIAAIEEINRLRRLQGTSGTTVTLISDAGASTIFDDSPSGNWLSQSLRVLHLMSDQPDEVRIGNIIRAGSTQLRQLGWDATPTPQDCLVGQPPAKLQVARRRASLSPSIDAYAYWSIRRLPKFHLGFECPVSGREWMAGEVRNLSAVPTAFRALPDALQARLINWGYLAAHHGIPYVDFAWPDPELRQRWLGTCSVPYGPDITDPNGDTPSAHDARCLRLVPTSEAR